MKKIIIAVCLAVLLLACGCRIKGIVTAGNTYKNASKYSAGNLTYKASEVDTVSISYISGDLTVVQPSSQSFNVTEAAGNLSDDQKVHWYMDGRTLRIQFAKSGYSGTFPVNSKKLTVEIPAGVNLEIVMTSGDTAMQGEPDVNSFTYTATSGDLNGQILRTGACKIASTSGDVSFSALHADGTEIGSTSGDALIGYLSSKKFAFGSTSGDLTAGLAYCSSFKASATSGNIHLTYLPADGATLRFAHTSGKLKADGYTVKGDTMVFGNGGCSIEVSTTSGNLAIDDMKYVLMIPLVSNPTTGCTWRVEIKDPTVVRLEGSEYIQNEAPAGMVGVGGHETFIFRGLKAGQTTIEFIYGHAWAPDEVYDRVMASVRVNNDLSLTATYPVSE